MIQEWLPTPLLLMARSMSAFPRCGRDVYDAFTSAACALSVRELPLQDLEELIIQAREMLRKIPGSFLQTVRSCCSDQCNAPLDTSRSLFCESVR